MAATFGYVVESLVSNFMGPYHPVPPTGYTIYYQVVSGGTRPDLVLRASGSGKDIVWADLTAKNSGGHIFLKDSWDKKVDRYAEITYPSVDGSTLLLMRGNRNNMAKLSQEEFEKRKKEVDLAYALKKAQWRGIGEKYRYGTAKKDIDMDQGFLTLHPEFKRDIIAERLKRDFNEPSLNEKLIPSILVAMNVDPGPWGFLTGSSSSEKTGEAWLTEHDPAAPDISSSGSGEKKEEKKENKTVTAMDESTTP